MSLARVLCLPTIFNTTTVSYQTWDSLTVELLVNSQTWIDQDRVISGLQRNIHARLNAFMTIDSGLSYLSTSPMDLQVRCTGHVTSKFELLILIFGCHVLSRHPTFGGYGFSD